MAPTPEQYRAMNVPILTITGHYDGDQPGAMSYYREHMQYGNDAARRNHYLIIGPWDHAGTRTPAKEVGGLTFGDASMLDMNKLHADWYDWTLKGGARPEFLKKRIAYYVAGPGAEEWKYADDLDSVATERRPLYLASSGGSANDVVHSGDLAQDPRPSSPDHYVYDPSDLRPAALESGEVENGYTDQRYALNLFGNGVVYHSEPFAEATEVSGYVKLTLWMSMDVPDTDLEATLYEILPDGTERATDGRRNARSLSRVDDRSEARDARRDHALRFHRLHVVLEARVEGQPAAPRGELPEQHLPREELQLGRARRGRVR